MAPAELDHGCCRYVDLLDKLGQADNERLQEMAGRALVHSAVQRQLIDHVYHGVNDGTLPPAAGSIIRVSRAETINVEIDTTLASVGSAGVVDTGDGLFASAERYLSRQTALLGGGTTEVARNVIWERVLGFPREYAADKGVPFNQVKRPALEQRRLRRGGRHRPGRDGRCGHTLLPRQSVPGHQRLHPPAQ